VAEGVPQKQGYKLVFAGRPGWMVEGLLEDIRNDASMGDQIIMIDDADDTTLDALYAGAAFCLYPSRYEGYGLPVVEAFAHGKAVLCSTAGALAELARDFSPCLDAADEEVWYATMREWILRPETRAPYEREIAARFRHPTWTEAAANFFRLVAEVGADRPASA
jgi:glycosyltransferase involved in cell wall biosynthesis